MSNYNDELQKLKGELIALGENEKELGFWDNFLDLMNESEKVELLDNLKKELEELRSVE